MHQNNFSNQYIKWNLENTAQNLYERFTNQFPNCHPHIWIIRASHWLPSSIACYNNFLHFTKSGVPLYENEEISKITGMQHLSYVLSNAVEHVVSLSEKIPNNRVKEISTQIMEFCRNLTDIYWLDSGHSGTYHHWPVLVNYLSLLNPGSCPVIHVHASPYQLANPLRPQKSTDFNKFLDILSNLNLPFKKQLHFMPDNFGKSESSSTSFRSRNEEVCSLSSHFEILNHFVF
ncbi:UPF0565 protein C2orf69 [Schistosoma japonicum]|nr:UPF0565 protein C2orf69 [Schistosoma japonicum]